MNKTTLAAWLSGEMKRAKLNNKGLAVSLKVSNSTVGNWLAGKIPDGDMLVKLGEKFNKDPCELFRMAYDLPDKGCQENPPTGGEQELIYWFRSLPSEGVRERVFAFLETLPPDNPLLLGGWGGGA